MSDEFLQVARQEIQSELAALEKAVIRCKDDSGIFENSKEIKGHLHKLKGLAPMIGEDDVGEMAKATEVVIVHVICKGKTRGSFHVIVGAVSDMKKNFSGLHGSSLSDFKKNIRDILPQVSGL